MEDPDRPGDHACPHTLVTSIPDGIHKHKHTHNVNRWIEDKPSDDLPAVALAGGNRADRNGVTTILRSGRYGFRAGCP